MRQLERFWRPWRSANRGSTRARWRRLSDHFSLDLPVAESAAVSLNDRPDPRDTGSRATAAFPWRPPMPDDEPEPA